MAKNDATREYIRTSLEGLAQLASWQMALAIDLQEKVEQLLTDPGPRGRVKGPPPIPRPGDVPMIKLKILPPRKPAKK
ncbi:MAG: hypothetical protein QGD94_09175 [Planctomycetia bacterium]|nr:hypothetical protein [Planctomycetia bacterium]